LAVREGGGYDGLFRNFDDLTLDDATNAIQIGAALTLEVGLVLGLLTEDKVKRRSRQNA
jgi:hypothetical protein